MTITKNGKIKDKIHNIIQEIIEVIKPGNTINLGTYFKYVNKFIKHHNHKINHKYSKKKPKQQ